MHGPEAEGQKGDYRAKLLEELATRKTRNSAYSLRAFARDLGINSTTLCDVLAQRRHLSKKNARLIAARLALSPGETQQLFSEIRRDGTEIHEGASPWFKVEDDTFTVISEWYYLAILSLARIPKNRASEAWISNRLGISRVEAKGAIDRLLRLKLIKVTRGRMYATQRPLITNQEIPNAARRRFHKQCIQKAFDSVDQVRVDHRFITSLTLPTDLGRMEDAKVMIMAFYKKISKIFETKHATEVYTLAIQLFPLTQIGGEQNGQGGNT